MDWVNREAMMVANLSRFIACLLVLACLLPCPALAAKARTGAEIYKADCVRCHGPKGEGVADKYDEPLYGDRSVDALARVIARTMPEDKDVKTTPDDAAKVAEYIFDAFYSPAARLRNQPARVQLARLTVEQHLNAVADLVGTFRTPVPLDERRGLKGEYYNGRNFRDRGKIFERMDPRVEFNFGADAPGTNKAEFAVRWEGSVIAEETGDYEFGLKTGNGARLWVNDQDKTLIDAWVSSGGKERDERATIRLLGGRAYPLKIDFFKYKDKTAAIALQWKPPHKTWETIPERNLTPVRVQETLVLTTTFPADDSSVGYERGTSISKAWHQAVTYAAVETATKVVDQLDRLSKCKSEGRESCLKTFCGKFMERAFRRPLEPEQLAAIDQHFKTAKDFDEAVKQVVLMTLKSPRFLYPEFPGKEPDAYDIASRLSFSLWDSLPDEQLLAAAKDGKLLAPSEVAAQTERMLKDERAKTKVRGFFHHWLDMEEGEDLSKDTSAYPGFSDALIADLRASLEFFIDDVVWSDTSDYRQLLQADYMFMNGRLAKFYGADLPEDSDFVKVAFQPQQRSGVITHPYLLSMFAYHKSTSPIHRGVFLTRNIVGRALKPPPMAIEFMDGRFDQSLTMREKVAELTRPTACQGCHSVINPLGFSLEHYDAVGQYRTVDNNKPVDATGEYTTADGKTVRLRGARDVAMFAAKNREAHRGFIQQLFHHLVKQPAAAYGPDTLEKLRASFAKTDYNIQKLVIEIIKVSATHGTQAAPGRDT